eukprot:3931623-Rhodomonas_salina.2
MPCDLHPMPGVGSPERRKRGRVGGNVSALCWLEKKNDARTNHITDDSTRKLTFELRSRRTWESHLRACDSPRCVPHCMGAAKQNTCPRSILAAAGEDAPIATPGKSERVRAVAMVLAVLAVLAQDEQTRRRGPGTYRRQIEAERTTTRNRVSFRFCEESDMMLCRSF